MNDFWTFWQNLPAHIDPVIFQIGSFRLHYYGLMYLVAFGCTYGLAVYRIKTEKRWRVSSEELQGLLTAMIIGLIVGARLGYVLFYNLGYYLDHPLEIVLPFDFSDGIRFTGISGMSYHGGLVGIIIASLWYIRRHRMGFREMADLLVPCIPLGYTFGRLGNFINGELWGRTTTAAIGMHFPTAPGDSLRHPSQLYEAFGEGILLFAVLWLLRKRVKTPGYMLAFYLIGYGTVRFVIEFFREPDLHLGFVLFFFSMGQVLSAAMVVGGMGLIIYFNQLATANRRKKK
jgi:phosphatidylglycerol---prolipoprotein diacylglyceryl transferase